MAYFLKLAPEITNMQIPLEVTLAFEQSDCLENFNKVDDRQVLINKPQINMNQIMAQSKTTRDFNMAYGIGAAIVIVGALFKIQHWDYGSEILTVGMIVEAFVFYIRF